MRKLMAWVVMHSLDGLLTDEGTEYWQFCFGLPVDPADLNPQSRLHRPPAARTSSASSLNHLTGSFNVVAGLEPSDDEPCHHPTPTPLPVGLPAPVERFIQRVSQAVFPFQIEIGGLRSATSGHR